jgi:hypothetical protein
MHLTMYKAQKYIYAAWCKKTKKIKLYSINN